MGFLSALFGARSGKGAGRLSPALLRLLPDEGAVAPEKGGHRRRGPEPGLPALSQAAWAEAGASAEGELVALRSELTGAQAAFLGLAGAEGQRELLVGAAAALAELAAGGDSGGFVVTAERASPAAVALLRGRAGIGRFFSARDGSVLVFVAEDVAAAVEAALAADPAKLDALGPASAASVPAPSSLSVDRDLDFVLPYFFMPPAFSAAPAAAGALPPPAVSVFWDEVAEGGSPGADSAWFVGSLGDPKAGLVALFELPVGGRPDRQEFAARVLPILREGWGKAAPRLGRLAPAGSAPRFGQIAQAPAAYLQGAVRAAGEIRLGSSGFPLVAWLPARLLAALVAALKPRLETPGGEGRPLAALVSANEALLELWAPGHREAFLGPRGAAGATRPSSAPALAALLRALGRRDAAIAVQNCLLSRYGAQGLPYVFFYHAPFMRNGKRAMRPFPFAPFRDADVIGLLPEAAREEWEHERRYDLPRRTVTANDCIAANEEAARLLWDAARTGKIELSPGSFQLLEEKVGKRLAAAAKAELEALAGKDIPFGFLATLERRDANRIVDRLSNRDLALASAGDHRHVELLRSAMGTGRRRDFDEELEIAESRLERGEASPESAAAMKLELLGRMQEIAEDLKRERAAIAAGPDRPPQRPARPQARR